eukprot:326948-Chlamydomonas_euryale.AAC.1
MHRGGRPGYGCVLLSRSARTSALASCLTNGASLHHCDGLGSRALTVAKLLSSLRHERAQRGQSEAQRG